MTIISIFSGNLKDSLMIYICGKFELRVIPFFNRTPHTKEKIRGVSNQAKNGYGSKNPSGVLTKFILNL